MFITGLGTAAPARRYAQGECWEFARNNERIRHLAPRSQALLRKVLLGDNGVQSRHLVLDSLEQALEIDPDTLHRRFAAHAPALAAQAAQGALGQAGCSAPEIDGLIISTCTGYLCPGLTSYVSERLGLRSDALLLDLVGQGCGAALPNLRTAEALVSSGRADRVLSVCVEVCSAAFYLDDDPGVLVSACLFGDGAAAAVLAKEPNPNLRRIEWSTSGTKISPADRDSLRFEQKNGLLRNVLTKEVPALAGQCAEVVFSEVLARAGVKRSRIAAWVLHAGGRTILAALQERLALEDRDLKWTAGILEEYGNLSSPCVLFVLEAAIKGAAPPGYWWMSSFGAGFSCHGALLLVS